MQDPDFVNIYHKRWSIAKHLLSPIFKDDSDKFLTGENLDSLSTVSEKERDRVKRIIDRNLPFLAQKANEEIDLRNKKRKSQEKLSKLLDLED